jgi:dolichol-phosphate mannosyltransferase
MRPLNSQTAEIAIIVPVYNEEENILPLTEEIIDVMRSRARSWELVFVDDASTDRTSQRIQEARRSHPFVRGLRHARNAGQSAALWTGIQASRSPVIVTLDGDRQNDPADLPLLLSELESCDFVCGVRAKRCDDWLRCVSTKVARAARKRVLKVDFCDTGCAFRAFKREAINGVFPFNGVHRFLPVLVHANGARTKEIQINHRPRVAGQSKYGLWDRLGRGIYDLIGIAWYQKRRIGPVDVMELEPQLSDENRIQPRARRTEPLGPREVTPEFHPVESD